MKRVLVFLIAFLVSATGIAADGADTGETVLQDVVSGCLETVLAIPVDTSEAADRLPDGYRPLDAFEYAGLPALSGQALVVLPAFLCTNSQLEGAPVEFSFIAVLIQSPDFAQLTLPPVDLELYIFSLQSSADSQTEPLRRLGFPTDSAAVTIMRPLATLESLLDTRTFDSAGAHFGHSTLFPTPPEQRLITIRSWHQTIDGLFRWEHKIETLESAGFLVTCTLRAGSPAAAAAGMTDCSEATSLALLHQELWATVDVMYLEGLRPAS